MLVGPNGAGGRVDGYATGRICRRIVPCWSCWRQFNGSMCRVVLLRHYVRTYDLCGTELEDSSILQKSSLLPRSLEKFSSTCTHTSSSTLVATWFHTFFACIHINHQIMSEKIQAKTLDDIPSKFPLIQGKEVGKVRACDLSSRAWRKIILPHT